MMTERNRVTNKCNFLGAVLSGGLFAVMFITGFALYCQAVFHDRVSKNRYLFWKWSFIISGVFLVLTLLFIIIDFIVKIRKNYFAVTDVSPLLYCFKTMGILILSFICLYFIIALVDLIMEHLHGVLIIRRSK